MALATGSAAIAQVGGVYTPNGSFCPTPSGNSSTPTADNFTDSQLRALIEPYTTYISAHVEEMSVSSPKGMFNCHGFSRCNIENEELKMNRQGFFSGSNRKNFNHFFKII